MKLTRRIEMTQEKIDRYGRLNGDNDIIHYDNDYAVARGFRGTLNHGMMTLGYIAELGPRRFGRDWFFRGEFKVKWIDPVCPGDELLVELDEHGHAIAKVEQGPVAKAELSLAEE
ncbi:MAG: MaoC family dehydratase [SAR324 cluster bacterium]|nr:MaoC family dehydratase [SAR324 cluster bacterium]MCZ6728729.1 MaoC family dehydratase [SAR324 cluster bacterium]